MCICANFKRQQTSVSKQKGAVPLEVRRQILSVSDAHRHADPVARRPIELPPPVLDGADGQDDRRSVAAAAVVLFDDQRDDAVGQRPQTAPVEAEAGQVDALTRLRFYDPRAVGGADRRLGGADAGQVAVGRLAQGDAAEHLTRVTVTDLDCNREQFKLFIIYIYIYIYNINLPANLFCFVVNFMMYFI